MSLLPRLPLAVTLAVALAAASCARAADARPNVVFVMTDDAGYGDFGCYGATDIRTPHVDRLAREGVRLTDFYAMPQCSPTRAALISGRYQQRVRIESAFGSSGRSLELGLPASGRTLPQLLKNHGYATGLVGKWHLGYKPEFSPQAHGFDDAFGPLSGYIDFYHHVRADGEPDFFENGRPVTVEGYTTDLFTARAARFIEQHAAQPFFLAVHYTAPHWPFQPPGKPSRAKNHGAFQSASDDPPPTLTVTVAHVEHDGPTTYT